MILMISLSEISQPLFISEIRKWHDLVGISDVYRFCMKLMEFVHDILGSVCQVILL